jgi:single-strand DNA-binding protein
MSSVNKVILIGRCGKDPDTRYNTTTGEPIVNVSVATSERYTDKTTGEKKEVTEWHRLVFFGKLAEIVGEYVRKGTAIYVEGKIRSRKWTDQSGQERTSVEIVCDVMRMLGAKGEGRSNAVEKGQDAALLRQKAIDDYAKASGHSGVQRLENMADDIPF